MTALKWITTEAKKIKKQYPKRFKTWTEYVKQASAIYASKHKGKSPVGKNKIAKKPVKSATKLHKDNKSHNVNIRVVSGVKKFDADVARLKEAYKEKLLSKIGVLYTLKLVSSTKREKNSYQKDISKFQSELRKLK